MRISAKEHPSPPNFALRGLFNISNSLMWEETLYDANGLHYGTKGDSYSNRALVSTLRSLYTCIYCVEYIIMPVIDCYNRIKK